MPVNVQGQFRRSVHLERDFYSEEPNEGYIVTAKARELLGRVIDALNASVAQRAWSVTGPYGGGKSAFALFLAGLLRGDSALHERLGATDPDLAARARDVIGGPFCPVLVVGSREALVPALLRGLAEALDAFAAGYERKRGRPTQQTQDVRDGLRAIAHEARDSQNTENDLLRLYDAAARAVYAATGGGLFVVVDEMGKMLEHAALYPETGDLFALQRLAERASRTGEGESGEAPILLFTVLHQAFDQYAGRLGTTQRDEWKKVQGRFEDVAFVEPVGETLRLLAEAIQATPDAIPDDVETAARSLLDRAELPVHLDQGAVLEHLVGAAPLHPAVAMLVGPLFRRLAQNERSLFAFLASGEPHSFLSVVVQEAPGLFADGPTFYRLDHLYDYLVANLGATLFSERMERLWAETETALASAAASDDLSAQLVKHAALLGFAGALAGLTPTAATLAVTCGVSTPEATRALEALREARALSYRPFGETYHVWQGSAFDLEAALRDAREQVPARIPLATLLRTAVPPAPTVARRHSYRTGTTRAFEVVYASEQDWRSHAEAPHDKADGRIVYVLPESDDPADVIEAVRAGLHDPMTFLAIPDGIASLRESVRDLARLDWVRSHADALKGDAAARREVGEQRAALASEVTRRLNRLLVVDAEGRNPCTWVRRGEMFRITGERALQETLSRICDAVYPLAPEVWNELLNRRRPSSSAVRGLKLLLAAVADAPGEERLGIEGTPAEYGMYASVLLATGMHRQDEAGAWAFGRPDESTRPGCAAVWDEIARVLRSADGQPVPVQSVFEALRAAPYGVREGLIPVFLFAFVQSVSDEVAFYESGSFVRELTFETMERLLKSEEKGTYTFSVQWVHVDGARADVLSALGPLLGLPASVRKPLPVAIRILQRVHGLAPFVRRTGTLTDRALAVRGALERATDPTRLVFETLPAACGAGSFLTAEATSPPRIKMYADGLQEALRELGGAYDALIERIQDQTARAFGLRSGDDEARRHELASRARAVLPAASDLRLKSFLVRASDEILDTRAWTESLAALLAKSPPTQWGDEDVSRFRLALLDTARAFDDLEPLALDVAERTQAQSNRAGANAVRQVQHVRSVRVLVKTLNEEEQGGVIHIHPEDRDIIRALYDRISAMLDVSDVHADAKIAALSKLTSDLFHTRDQVRMETDLPTHD